MIKNEPMVKRSRTIKDHEYRDLIRFSPRWLQRVIIGANETGLDLNVLCKLTWDRIDDGLIKVRRPKTGVEQRVAVSPQLAPILDELKSEYQQLPNMQRLVFTNNGRGISKFGLQGAWRLSKHAARITDFQFRDFRHSARTRWAAAGLPYEIGEIAIGHAISGIPGTYLNLSDDHIRAAFRKMFTACQQENQKESEAKEKTA